MVVAESVAQAVDRWRVGADRVSVFDADVDTARRAWAQLVGVASTDVAIGATASQLVGLVAASVPDNTRVLTVGREFTSVTFPFAAQAHRGVTVTEVPHAQLISTMDDHDLVAISVAQSADGRVVDLPALREAAEATGTRVLLDVTQALGWLPLRLDWADWVVCAGYKWLMSPRGAAWLAMRADAREITVPHQANWYAGADRWGETIYGMPIRLAADARGFDLAPVWFAQVGAAVALPWLTSLDPHTVRAHCVGLADGLLAELGLPAAGSAIVSLEIEDGARRLAEFGIRASVRAGRIRLAFHLYNTVEDVDMVLSALRARL
jgi:selenocysteine lyase/cysteine desulfurase